MKETSKVAKAKRQKMIVANRQKTVDSNGGLGA